jgi:hypothetical protein
MKICGLELGANPNGKSALRAVMTKILQAIEATAKNRVECVAGSAYFFVAC